MRWFWGALIIFVGVVILGVNLGWWALANIGNLWQLWPLILIVIGVSIIFRHFRFGWIVTLVIFILALMFALAMLGPINSNVIRSNNIEIKTSDFSEDLPTNVTSADIKIKTGASDVHLGSSSAKLIEGTLKSAQNPNLSIDIADQKANVVFDLSNPTRFLSWTKNSLDVRLTDKVPVLLSIDAGASSLSLDCSNLNLNGATFKTGAASLDLKLGEKIKNDATIDIDSGASSITIAVPKNLGVKVVAKSGVSSKNFNGFDKIDSNNYQTPDYQNAQNKITIMINAGASSMEINRY